MNNYYVDMFKIPLLHLEVTDWETKKEQLKELFDFRGYNNTEVDGMTSDYLYKVDSGNIQKNNDEIDRILLKEIGLFKDFFEFSDHEIIISWFQRTLNGQYHGVHNHGSSGYTGVCYIDYDPKVHEPTKFIAPFNHFIRTDTLHFSPSNINEGSLVFFPSVINHYAEANHTNVPRTILSFNLKLKMKDHNTSDQIFDKLNY